MKLAVCFAAGLILGFYGGLAGLLAGGAWALARAGNERR